MYLRVMIGIFSYNEGTNLPNIVHEILDQTTVIQSEVVLLDESDDTYSLRLVNQLIEDHGLCNLGGSGKRMGKVHLKNALFKRFIESTCDYLMHFDSDQLIDHDCIRHMLEALEAGADVISALNLSLPGRNFFERAVRITLRPAELSRSVGASKLPLVGHNGGYSRHSVIALFPIPEDGKDEEIWILHKAAACGLRCQIVTNAKTSFRVPASLSDYISSSRRVNASKLKFLGKRSVLKNDASVSGLEETAVTDDKVQLVAQLDKNPAAYFILHSLKEDPLGSILLPWLLLVRLGIRLSSEPLSIITWSPVRTSKELE